MPSFNFPWQLFLVHIPIFISITMVVYVTFLTIFYPWPKPFKFFIISLMVGWLTYLLKIEAVQTFAVITRHIFSFRIGSSGDQFWLALRGFSESSEIWTRLLIYLGGLSIVFLEATRLSRLFYYRSFDRERLLVRAFSFLFMAASWVFGLPFLIASHYWFQWKWRYVEVVIQGSPVFENESMGIFIIRFRLFLEEARRLIQTKSMTLESYFRLSDRLRVPTRILDTGLLLMGAAGSGKTSTAYNWFILRGIERGHRSIIFDYKGDYTAALGEAPGTAIISIFDKRSLRWAIGQDVNTSNKFLELMWALVATTGSVSKQKFFDSSFVDVATAIFMALREKSRESWTFRDLYKMIHEKEAIEAAIERHRPEAALLFSGEESGDQTAGIMGTIREKMMNIEAMSRVWNDPSIPSFPLLDFISDAYAGEIKTVILRVHPQYRSLSSDLVSMFLEMLISGVTSLPEAVGNRHIHLHLDELQTLPMIPALMELPRVGRSKGLRVYFGTQDLGKSKVLYRDEGGVEGLKNSIGLKLLGLLSGDEAKADAAKMCDTVRIERWQRQLRGKAGSEEGHYVKTLTDQPALVSGAFSLPAPSLSVPASFYLKYADWPIVKLRYSIKPLPKRYPDLIEADWIKDLDILKRPPADPTPPDDQGEEEDNDKKLALETEKKKPGPKMMKV